MSAFSENVTSKDIICDNCGDVGIAERIATCFRCSERSEHTVPEDRSWGTNRASEPSDRHLNTNYRHKQLVITGGVPPHHPVPNACWTGDFKIFDRITNAFIEIQGIQAHIPSIVSLNVYEIVKRLSVQDIKLKLLRRVEIWPALFVLEPPQLGDIGLFFFPSKEERLKQKFTSFVSTMDRQGLAMKGHLPNAKILIFTSSQLPPDAHGVVPEVCLWGVLRGTRPKKQIAKDQEKLAVTCTPGDGKTLGDENHGSGSSSRSRSEGMANVGTDGPNDGKTDDEKNHGTGRSSSQPIPEQQEQVDLTMVKLS